MPRILFTLRLLTAVATVIVIAFLCVQCIDIYLDGKTLEMIDMNNGHMTSVFRMDDIVARLSRLAAPMIGYLFLVVVTTVMYQVRAKMPPGTTVDISPENRLRLMKSRLTVLPSTARREEKMRHMVLCVAGAVVAVCIIGALGYLLNGRHFISWDLEMVIGTMLLSVLPWLVSAFVSACVASVICQRSILREIDALKSQRLALQKGKTFGKSPAVGYFRFFIFVLAIVFIAFGVINGGLHDVLVKAINICTECIGLG